MNEEGLVEQVIFRGVRCAAFWAESKEVVDRTWHSRTGGDLPARPMEVWTQQARAQNRWLHWHGQQLDRNPDMPLATQKET